jgi:hypothetical protein
MKHGGAFRGFAPESDNDLDRRWFHNDQAAVAIRDELSRPKMPVSRLGGKQTLARAPTTPRFEMGRGPLCVQDALVGD